MWHIHGKTYDLTEFIDKHPGGADILLKTKGEKDITSLFETYHAFSNKEKIGKMLDKYEVNDVEPNKDVKQYDFTNYDKLLTLVKEKFPNRKTIKATPFRTIVNIFSLLFYLHCFYVATLSQSALWVRCLNATLAGVTWLSIGFNVMHDASHYGVSLYPKVNNLLSKLWNGFGLWNPAIWFYHHVYHHHSFTSEESKDPDLYHLAPFFRKTKFYTKKFIITFTKYQGNIILSMILWLMTPGSYYGQALSYVNCFFKKRLFGIKFPNVPFYDITDICLMAANLYCLYKGLFLPTILYMIVVNATYHFNIVLDHDTYETAVENHYNGKDWLRLQIQNSGNFMNDNLVWTYAFGAINYQIEHHLFPNMSSVHYPDVKPIVVKFCKEHNIPYVHHHTLWGGYKSHLKMIEYNKWVDDNEKKD
jgi:linoleoyl-CoA desaturase